MFHFVPYSLEELNIYNFDSIKYFLNIEDLN